MGTVFCIDQLRRDPDAVTALANTALKNIPHAKLLRRFADVARTSFVNEAGIARDDAQPCKLRQGGDNVFDQAIAEMLLLWVAGHVLEGQNGN